MSSPECVCNVVFFGHVDSGKSTTIGRILVDTNAIPRKCIKSKDKCEEKINYAWATDELCEERERGITMDFVTNTIKHKEVVLNLIDTPGHSDYMPNMMKGLFHGDIAVFIIDASPDNFEKSYENGVHSCGSLSTKLLLTKSYGINSIIVASNKIDMAFECEERYNYIVSIISKLMKKYSFKSSEYVVLPISALTGLNLINTRSNDELLWYKELSLLDTIVDFAKNRVTTQLEIINEESLYISISDFYEGKSNCVVVIGKILNGHVKNNMLVMISPSDQQSKVKDIRKNGMAECSNDAKMGDIVELTLVGGNIENFDIGYVITNQKILKIKNIIGNIITLNLIQPITPGLNIIFHSHNLMIPASISKLLKTNDKKISKNNPRMITQNSSALIEISFDKFVALESMKICRPLGRFALFYHSKPIAVGIVENLN